MANVANVVNVGAEQILSAPGETIPCRESIRRGVYKDTDMVPGMLGDLVLEIPGELEEAGAR